MKSTAAAAWRRVGPSIVALGLAAAAVWTAMPAAQATVVTGTSTATGLIIDLDLTRTLRVPGEDPVVTHQIVRSGPVANAAGTAPGPFDTSAGVPSTSWAVDFATTLAAGRFLDLSTGPLASRASADIDGGRGERSTLGSARADAVAFAFFLNEISISADLVWPGSGAAGDHGSLVAGGITLLRGAQMSLAGLAPRPLPTDPEANTVIDALALFGFDGVSLVLNEQILLGDGVFTIGMLTNGIHLHFDHFVVDPSPEDSLVLSGDLIIGQARSELRVVADAALPAPASAALVIVALALLGIGPASRAWRPTPQGQGRRAPERESVGQR